MDPINISNTGFIYQPPSKKQKTEKKRKTSFFDKLRAADKGESYESHGIGDTDANLEDLLDDLHGLGDVLKKSPTFSNVQQYKEAVRQFMQYVVKNSYGVDKKKLSRFQVLKRQGQPELTLITVIDKKLETLAAGILQNQLPQIEVLARVNEIQGLLVDLIQ